MSLFPLEARFERATSSAPCAAHATRSHTSEGRSPTEGRRARVPETRARRRFLRRRRAAAFVFVLLRRRVFVRRVSPPPRNVTRRGDWRRVRFAFVAVAPSVSSRVGAVSDARRRSPRALQEVDLERRELRLQAPGRDVFRVRGRRGHRAFRALVRDFARVDDDGHLDLARRLLEHLGRAMGAAIERLLHLRALAEAALAWSSSRSAPRVIARSAAAVSSSIFSASRPPRVRSRRARGSTGRRTPRAARSPSPAGGDARVTSASSPAEAATRTARADGADETRASGARACGSAAAAILGTSAGAIAARVVNVRRSPEKTSSARRA